MTNTHDTLGIQSTKEIYEKQIGDMQLELKWAHERIHILHDIINKMKTLSEDVVESSETRWIDYSPYRFRRKETQGNKEDNIL